jgi:hypothetical protein
MAIIKIILTNISGSFSLDAKEINLEWIVFSDAINDFSIAIAQQGTIYDSIDADTGQVIPAQMVVNGEAKGWLPPGSHYHLGNEYWLGAFAGALTVSDRKIIRGTNNRQIQIGDGKVEYVPATPEGLVQWKVTQKYSTNENKAGSDEPSADDAFTMKMSVETEEVPFERDVLTGKLVVNSAKQFFSPPTTIKRKINVYSITRREPGNPVWKAKTYTNVVNTEIWYNALPGTLLMESITCDFDGKAWSNVTYTFKEKLEGWQTMLLDAGTAEFDDDGNLVAILNDDGTAVSEPVKLDGTGHKMDNQDDVGVDVGPFWKYAALPFTPLFLPNIYNIVSQPQW